MNEFDLIKKYFTDYAKKQLSKNVLLGIGDDCALLSLDSGYELAVSTDTFIEDTHFFAGTKAYDIGYKSLAVNLSDLAAMNAKPLGFTLALTIPKYDENFLAEYSKGLFDLANKYNVPLIGGDTTRGKLSITITVLGQVNKNKAFLRSNAKVGDLICVSGDLGGAALAVKSRYENFKEKILEEANTALDRPNPRLDIIDYLSNVLNCRCALDISDGILGDLQHIVDESNVSANIFLDYIPYNRALSNAFDDKIITRDELYKLAIAGGDDYQLLFTISKDSYTKYLDSKNNNVGSNQIPTIFVIGEIVENSVSKKNLVQVFETKEQKAYDLNKIQAFSHF